MFATMWKIHELSIMNKKVWLRTQLKQL